MRPLLFALLCTTFFSEIHAQFSYRHLTEHYNAPIDIQGANIKRENIYSFAIKNKKVLDSVLVAIVRYNNDGNINTREEYNNNNELTTLYRYYYNGKGQLVKVINEKVDLKMISNIDYEYDSLERVVYQSDYNQDTTRLTVNRKVYDPVNSNQVKQLQLKLNNGSFYTSRELYYDEKGRVINEVALDQTGKSIYAYKTEYNDRNHKKSLFLENSDGRIKQSETTFNNFDQRLTHKSYLKVPVFISPGNNQYRQMVAIDNYTYNGNKTLYEWKHTKDGQLVQLKRSYYYQD